MSASALAGACSTLVDKLNQAYDELKAVPDSRTMEDLFESIDAVHARNLNMQTARSLVLLQTFIAKCQVGAAQE